MVTMQQVEPLPGYRLRLHLSDGRTVERDLRHLVPATADPNNVFTPWRDPSYFAQVRLADYGTVVWPNGVDLDPDVLIRGITPIAEPAMKRHRGPQKTPTKTMIAIRIDREALARYRATGRGWQTRLAADVERCAARLPS
jgi:hypothetical protein